MASASAAAVENLSKDGEEEEEGVGGGVGGLGDTTQQMSDVSSRVAVGCANNQELSRQHSAERATERLSRMGGGNMIRPGDI